jgi:pimeloyl-ACP methyl ester carboxylesterase
MTKPSQKVFSLPKSILYTGKVLSLISPKLATSFAFKLFMTPYKFPRPKREEKMYQKAEKEKLFIPELKKNIQLYHCGNEGGKVLLVHGWAGRGTQLHSIAQALHEKGFHSISFDATAHGESEGKMSAMTEFISSIHEIDRVHGPFSYAIGHSLGGMALMNAIAQKFKVEKLITIGSGDSINDICHSFVKRLQLKPKIGDLLKDKLDKVLRGDAEQLSTHIAAKKVSIPVLIVHDTEDEEVPLSCAHNIDKYLKNSKLHITEGLGHRKILWHNDVIDKIIDFLNQDK